MIFNWCVTILYVFAATCFTFIVYLYAVGNYISDWACADYDKVEKEYDYIVVGGGSAGSLVADLLSQEEDNVLLIEAGIEASSSIFNIPVSTPLLQLSNLDWKYQTEPHTNACYALKNHASRWPMGKVLGGTSKLNSLIYLRGHARDFDAWSDSGCKGWAYQDVLPYFKKSESMQRTQKISEQYHGRKGPAVVSHLEWTTPLVKAFLGAGRSLGFKITDLNGPHQTGFMQAQVNLNKGARWSAEQPLLQKPRKNLRVITSSVVEKVLVRDKFEAYGVVYRKWDNRRAVRARKGVILSAGVIGTPKILMLSGIGPAEHLKEIGILPVVRDLPVGKNLQDHITTGLDLVLLNQSLPLSLAAVESPFSFFQYALHGKGPWTFPGCEAVAVVHTLLSDSAKDPPDLQLMVLPTGISSDGGVHLRRAVGITDKVWNDYFSPLSGFPTVSILPILLHPKSKGEVLLRSANPIDPPVVRANYLAHQHDVKTLLEGIKLMKALIQTEPMQKLGARLYNKQLPGCGLRFDSAAYWECYMRHLTLTSFHPAGTCKMGGESDPSAVVDPYLRVRSMHKLFVIDASVMPSLPSANINAAVMMIAQKGAALVQAHWKLLHGKCRRRPWFMSLELPTRLPMCFL